MKQVLGFILYLFLQILFIPVAIIGLIVGLYVEMHNSKKLGVSFSAGQALQYRWTMHMFDTRKDKNTIRFVKVFPCESHFALWAIMGPFIIAHKLLGFKSTFNKQVDYGYETLDKIAGNRVRIFDDIVTKYVDQVEQIVIPGGGFDLIAQKFTENKDVSVYELDQSNTTNIKLETLKKANIPHSWIKYIPVNYETESWAVKLLDAGFDTTKKTLFLWQSVSLYLEEILVKESIEKMVELCAEGSIIAQDFYSLAFLKGEISKMAVKNMDMIAKQGEPWKFGLDMSQGYKDSVATYLTQFSLTTSIMYNFGEKLDMKPAYTIVESIIE